MLDLQTRITYPGCAGYKMEPRISGMPGHYSTNGATFSAWDLRLANALSLAQAVDALPPCHWLADSKLSIALILACVQTYY